MHPTVVVDLKDTTKCMQEEIFGKAKRYIFYRFVVMEEINFASSSVVFSQIIPVNSVYTVHNRNIWWKCVRGSCATQLNLLCGKPS